MSGFEVGDGIICCLLMEDVKREETALPNAGVFISNRIGVNNEIYELL